MSSALIIGNESLTIQCADALVQRGHSIAALVTRSPEVRAWGLAQGLRVEDQGKDLADRLGGLKVDWLLSIANLNLVPDEVLALAAETVNFHDGPLPRYAGLNAPVWAILNGEARHGVTWHRMETGVDEGAILEQRLFDIAPGETALTLNTKCFEAAIDSFSAVLTALESGASGQPPDLISPKARTGSRRWCGRWIMALTATRSRCPRSRSAVEFWSSVGPGSLRAMVPPAPCWRQAKTAWLLPALRAR